MYLDAVRRQRVHGNIRLSTLRAIARRRAPGLVAVRRPSHGFGLVSTTIDPTATQPAWQKTLSDLVQTGLSVFQAERLRKENLERIRAGLPPLTDAQMRALAPTANVNVALPPAIQYGALAGGAALIYLLATRRR